MNFYYYSKDHVLHSVSLATTLCTFLLTVSSVVLFIVFFLKHFVFQFLVNFLAFIYFISRSSSTCFLLSFQSVSISFSHPLQSMKWFSYCSDSSLFQLFFFEQTYWFFSTNLKVPFKGLWEGLSEFLLSGWLNFIWNPFSVSAEDLLTLPFKPRFTELISLSPRHFSFLCCSWIHCYDFFISFHFRFVD